MKTPTTRQLILCITLLLFATQSLAQSANPGQNATVLVIRGATLIDGSGAPPIADSAVVINRNRITAAGPAAKIRVPRGARVIDARGKWITPGLIDAHVHFFQSGGLYTRPDVIDLRQRVPYERELEWIRNRLEYTFTRYLVSGITSVVDVGGPMWNFKVREIASRTEAAPRVAVAGPLVSTYAPERLKTGDPAIIRVNTADEARDLVRRELAQKPDLIKIWFIRRPGSKLEELEPIAKAAIDESHARGVRVAVHATELETAKAAVRAGCDVLVHSVFNDPVDDEFIKLVKERGVIYTPTIVVTEGYAEVLGRKVDLNDVERAWGDPEVIKSWDNMPAPSNQSPGGGRRGVNKVTLDNLKRMQAAGCVIAAGTDAGNIGTLHGPSLHREFELMAEAGLSPIEIIVAATQNAARVFAREPKMGVIKAGQLADLLILNQDPTADIKNLRKIDKVIKDGVVFDHSALVNAKQ
jgi:imidazolonepropionase-like amidohydrolase